MSVERQTLAPELFELLVVDNGSEDTTWQVIQTFSARFPCTAIHEPVVGLSRARNTGWKAANTEHIAFLDDDAVADPDWLAGGLRVFESVRPVPLALTGPIRLTWEKQPPPWLTEDVQGCLGLLDFGPKARMFGGEETLFGANCFFHRSALTRFGGFNERLGRFNTVLLSGEETLLQRQIENAGGRLWYDPDVSVQHWVAASRTTRSWFYRRYYWGGVSDYFMQKILGPVTGCPDSQRQGGRFRRLLKNLVFSLGLGNQRESVHGRIYLCYVIGWFAGGLKWQRSDNAELTKAINNVQ